MLAYPLTTLMKLLRWIRLVDQLEGVSLDMVESLSVSKKTRSRSKVDCTQVDKICWGMKE